MRRPLICITLLLFTLDSAKAVGPVDDAKALLDQLQAAWKAKDADAISKLLAKDCVIIMEDPPSAGAKGARFFDRDSYLKLLHERLSSLGAFTGKESSRSVTASPSGDVFIIGEVEERTRIEQRSEWLKYNFYAVARYIDGKMLFRLIVSQIVFYFPDVPPPPEGTPKT
jgi:hypothetical protein